MEHQPSAIIQKKRQTLSILTLPTIAKWLGIYMQADVSCHISFFIGSGFREKKIRSKIQTQGQDRQEELSVSLWI